MKQIKRRDFFRTGTLLGGSALIFGCGQQQTGDAPAVTSTKSFQWNLVTAWPPHFPVMGEGLDMMATWIAKMSQGRLKIKVFGGGELVPALETFDTVSQGIAEMGHGAAYYWAGKVPAAQFFTAVPFGMNAQHMNAWLYSGGGLKLWEDLYTPFNLVPMPAGNTGMQMGGWFNKEINAPADLKGLKMRIPGLGARVLEKAGASPILMPAGEIYTSLERGVIDASEWVGPYHDSLMGFDDIARYCYYPGWHELGPVLELIINKSKWESLPEDLQEIIRTAAFRVNIWMLAEFEAKNSIYLQKLQTEGKVEFRQFPEAVMQALRRYSDEVITKLTAENAKASEIYASFDKFRKQVGNWSAVSEKMYYTSVLS